MKLVDGYPYPEGQYNVEVAPGDGLMFDAGPFDASDSARQFGTSLRIPGVPYGIMSMLRRDDMTALENFLATEVDGQRYRLLVTGRLVVHRVGVHEIGADSLLVVRPDIIPADDYKMPEPAPPSGQTPQKIPSYMNHPNGLNGQRR